LNYEFIFDERNRDTISDLLIQAIVKNKLIISLRALLNFFYDVIVPIGYKWENLDAYMEQLSKLKTSELLNVMIPNYLFEHPELSVVFEKMSKLDPCRLRYSELDLELIRLINSDTPKKIFSNFIGTESLEIITDHLSGLMNEKLGSKAKNDALTKSFIRLNFFTNRKDVMAKSEPYYLEYMITLHHFNNHQMEALEKIYDLVQDAARRWYGDPNKTNMVVLHVGKKQSKYRVFKSFKAEPYIELVDPLNRDLLTKFVQEFSLKFKVDGEAEPARIHVDFGLYKILNQIITGYLPNRKDSNNYLSFVGLINRLINQDCEKAELEIDAVNIGEASDFKLSKDAFGHYKFQSL
jgi:DNA phosphorothioation-dependent restriction protein DptF